MKKLVISFVLIVLTLSEPYIAPYDRLFGKLLAITLF